LVGRGGGRFKKEKEESEFEILKKQKIRPRKKKEKKLDPKLRKKNSKTSQLTSLSVPVLATHRYAAACAGGIAHFTT